MSYNLNTNTSISKTSIGGTIERLLKLMGNEKKKLYIAIIFILINVGLNLLGPLIIGHTVDKYVISKQFNGVIYYSIILLLIYIVTLFTSRTQALLMGKVGQRMLFNLRNSIFNKLQELPIDFFNQNKAGDLISRVNNDTDKINQFFSQSLVQFMNSIFSMIGAGIFLISINFELGIAALIPALLLFFFTKSTSNFVKKTNSSSMKSTGLLSAEIQESLNNFKIIVAFNRRDYLRDRFAIVNKMNYKASLKSGIANNIYTPVFGFSSNLGQLVVLTFGIYLISKDQFSLGLLISFLAYVAQFYNPLRQLAALWANFQIALAGWDRIAEILHLQTNLPTTKATVSKNNDYLLSFSNVSFSYVANNEILSNINFDIEKGKTYAFVGPTGGGKTTTASLIARLYDPTSGTIYLNGRDIRSYSSEERTAKIGFILQEPIVFTGNLRDNILYGNACFNNLTDNELINEIKEVGLESLLQRFEKGLQTEIKGSGDEISLGQKQIIAFMRAVIRRPDLLILDEATANIDTITEQLLDEIIKKLPKKTVKIIIAHRLNTIENADEIFFINGRSIIKAGSMEDALTLLHNQKRNS